MININKLKEYISEERITSEELFSDIQSFLEEEYEQKGSVFKRSSPFGMILTVLVGLTSLIFFYLEDTLMESNRFTAKRSNTIRGFSSLVGHQPHTRIAASGALDFSFRLGKNLSGNKLTITNNTILKNIDNNLKYSIILQENNLTLNTNNITQASFKANVAQGEFTENIFVSNNEKMQSYSITDNVIDINFVKVYINGKEWTKINSFYDMQFNQESFLIKTNFDGGADIIFGNGNFGKIPNGGADIRIEYLKTNGEAGNIEEGNNWEFETPGTDTLGQEVDLNELYTVSVESPIIYGSNEESIEFTKLIAPHKSMTFSLINANDYTSFLKRFNQFSTVKTFTEFNDKGNLIEILLVPNLRNRLTQSNNYFSLNESKFLLTDYEKTKIERFLALSGNQAPNLDLKILSPKITRYSIDIIVRAFAGEEDYIVDKIKNMTSEYFLTTNRKDFIPSSDLIYLYEKINGLDSVNVYFISEENEKVNIQENNTSGSVIGLDQMNDIKISKNELPIIRGGWSDRFGQVYNKNTIRSFQYLNIIDKDEPIEKGAINIFFQPSLQRNINTELLEKEIKNID